MARRRRFEGTLALPWEHSSGWLRSLLGKGRLSILLAGALGISLVVGAHHTGAERGRRHSTWASIAELERATHAFIADMERCPEDVHELLHPPRTGTRYLTHLPEDGWGKALRLECDLTAEREPSEEAEQEAGPRDSVLAVSAGPSGSFFEDDNIE